MNESKYIFRMYRSRNFRGERGGGRIHSGHIRVLLKPWREKREF